MNCRRTKGAAISKDVRKIEDFTLSHRFGRTPSGVLQESARSPSKLDWLYRLHSIELTKQIQYIWKILFADHRNRT